MRLLRAIHSSGFRTRSSAGLSVFASAISACSRRWFIGGSCFVPVFLLLCLSAWALVPWLGENFFPDTDSGQFSLHMRAKTGTRIEETARLADLVENSIRRVIPAQELDNILDNIGLPYSTINYMHNTSGLISAADADILVSLKENHRPTAEYVRELRKKLRG